MATPAVQTENCANCGGDTGIPTAQSRDRREHFIEGEGQFCRDCFHGLFVGACHCPGDLPAYRTI